MSPKNLLNKLYCMECLCHLFLPKFLLSDELKPSLPGI